jgi:hypothetical protein
MRNPNKHPNHKFHIFWEIKEEIRIFGGNAKNSILVLRLVIKRLKVLNDQSY